MSTLITTVRLAIAYYAGTHIGLALTFETSAVSPLWPPNAIVLATLLVVPRRMWPVLIGALLPVHLITQASLDVPWVMSLCWYVSNMAEALLGAMLVRQYLGNAGPRFDRIRDVAVFLLTAVVAAPMLTSFLDASCVALVGWHYSGYWAVWWARLLSNALAMLTLVPLILVFAQQDPAAPLVPSKPRDALESAAIVLGLCAISVVVFLQTHGRLASAVLIYVPLPFLIWAAIRRNPACVILCLSIVATFATLGALHGHGPFAGSASQDGVLALQAFLILATSCVLLLSASLAEVRNAKASALHQQEALDLALSAAQMQAWSWDIAADRLSWGPGQFPATDPEHLLTLSSFLDRVHADDREAVSKTIESALKQCSDLEIDCRLDLGERGIRWISGKGKVLPGASGQPERVIGVYLVTTRRKAQEMQAHGQREQLMHTLRLDTLRELCSTLAHELNQPLTAILMNAQATQLTMHMRAPTALELNETLHDVTTECKRAGSIVHRLQALFPMQLELANLVDMNECITQVLAMEQCDLLAYDIVTAVNLDAESCPVIADRLQLQQVLFHLIVNARDAIEEASPKERRLRITSRCDAQNAVHVAIADTGHGISDLGSLFKPLHSTRKRKAGLGLAICRTIVAGHRGHLWATNNADGGATFHFCIPAR